MAASVATYPSPTGGWNAIDALDAMPPQCAVILDNIFPNATTAQMRKGYSSFCATGEPAAVQSLMEYNGGATVKLIAACNNKIIDVSSGVAAVLSTGYHSDIWSHVNFATGGGTFLLAANASGSDTPIVYNGAAVAAIVAAGPGSLANLSQVMIYNQRTFYVEKNTLSVWYTAAGAFQGALTQFDFGPFCSKGGSIAAITTWTRDNGYGGADDLFVVITTKGQVLLYNGPNPSVATLWNLAGVFNVGEPVAGPRCFVRTGPDILLICADGFQPLSEYLSTGATRAQTTDLAHKIGNAASDAVRSTGTLTGWQGFVYPRGTALYVNVPQDSTTFYQYVVNTATGAWCRYKGMNAYCWSLFNNAPYFGGAAGVVYLSDTGYLDGASAITGEWQPAFQSPGQLARLSQFKMARPVIRTTGDLQYTMTLDVDYNTGTFSTFTTAATVTGSTILRNWSSVTGLGYSAAPHMWISRTEDGVVELVNTQVTFEMGGVV